MTSVELTGDTAASNLLDHTAQHEVTPSIVLDMVLRRTAFFFAASK
mgnify:CR=1 FL=1